MWRRVVLAVLGAGVGALLLLGLFLRSESGSARLCGVAVAALQESTRQELSVEHCALDIFGGSVALNGVRIGPAGSPLVTTERLSAALEWRKLLSGKVRISGVELLRPRWTARIDRWDDTESAARDECLPSLGVLELGVVSLVDGALDLHLPGQRHLTAAALSATVTGEETRLRLKAAIGAARLEDPEGAENLHHADLDAAIDLASAEASLDRLDIDTDVGTLFAKGTLSNVCHLRGAASLSLESDLDRLGKHLLREIPGLGGDVSLTGEVDLAGDDTSALLRLAVRDGKVSGVTLDAINATIKLSAGRLVLQELQWPLPSGRIDAVGALSLRAPFEADLDLKLEQLVLGELMARLGRKDLSTHLVLDGSASLSGPLGGRAGRPLAVEISAGLRAFAVLDRPWHRRGAPGDSYVQLPSGKLATSVRIGGDQLEIASLQFDAPSTRLLASGTIPFDSRRPMHLELEFPQLDASELGPFAGEPIEARGSLSGTIDGPAAALRIDARAQLSDIIVAQLELGRLDADVHIDNALERLEVSRADGQIGQGRWSGTYLMEFGPRIATGNLALEKMPLSDLVAVARRRKPSLGSWAGQRDALISGELSITGPRSAPDASGELQLTEIRAGGFNIPRGAIRLRAESMERFFVDDLMLELDGLRLNLQGSYDRTDDRFRVELDSTGLEARDLGRFVGIPGGLRGGLRVAASGEGTLDDPRIRGQVELVDWWLDEQPLVAGTLDVSLAGDTLKVAGPLRPTRMAAPTAAQNEGSDKRPDDAKDAPPRRTIACGNLEDQHLRLEASLTGDKPFELSYRLNLPELAPLLPESSTLPVRPALNLECVTAQGSLDRPRDTAIEAAVSGISVAADDDLRCTVPGTVYIRYLDGTLAVDEFRCSGDGFRLSLNNLRREPDGTVDVATNLFLELPVVGARLPSLGLTAGEATISASLNGEPELRNLVGSIFVEGLAMRPKDLPFGINNGRGDLGLSAAAIFTRDMSFEVNGRRIGINGQVNLESLRPKAFELELDVPPLPLRVDDIPLVVSGTPRLSGTPDQITLGGEVQLDKLVFQRDLELERTIVQAVELALQRRPPPVPRVFERSREFLTLDVGLRLGDVRIENNLLKAALRGDLRLTGTNRRPGLLGAVTFNDARAILRGNELQISSGILSFTDRFRLRPSFDVRADSQIRDYKVHVVATGTAQQPRVLLSSEPALPEADVLTLLTLGVTSRDFDTTGAASLGGFLLDAAYNASGLGNQVKKLLPRTDLLRESTLRITSAYNELSGNIEPMAQFEGKLGLDNLKLRGQTSLVGRGRRAQAEWRINDQLSGIVQIDGDSPSVPTADFGADLNWHLERP